MKKFYILCGALIFSGMVMAQTSTLNPFPGKIKTLPVSANPYFKAANSTNPAPQAVIWSDDFSVSSNWTMTNDVGNADNWVIGTAGPNCQYAIADIASTTAANGFALFDSDCYCSGNQIANLTTATPINLTGKPTVRLEFQQYHRRYYDSTFVYVSNNNSTWVKYPINTNYANNAYSGANPTITNVDISATAGNQATVWIRFTFYSPNSLGANAGCGYSWMVDDVKILDAPDNDLKIAERYYYTSADSSSMRYYTRVPVKQAPTDTIIFGADIKNEGSAAQSNTKLTVSVTGVQTATFTSTPTTEPSGAASKVDVTAPFNLSGLGNYNINFSVSSDSADAFASNNSIKDTVIVTDTVYARDNNMPSSGSWYGQQADNTFYIVGNLFRIGELDTCSSLSVFIGNFAAPYAQAGKTISLKLYQIDANGDFIEMASNDFYLITTNDLGTWLTLPLNPVSPFTSTELTPGYYIAGYEAFNDTTIMVTGAGDPPAPLQTTFVNIEGVWYFTENIPLIRINTKGAFVPCAGISATATSTGTCGGATGTATATLTGGTAVSYLWSNSQTTQTATGLAGGTYSVTITDANGCTANANVTVNSVTVNATTASTNTTCGANNGTATVTATGGGTYTYFWSNNATSASINGLAAGSYFVTVTSSGCTDTASVTIASSNPLAATTTAVDAACGQNNGSASVSSPTGTGYTYLWTGGMTTAQITGLAAGSYTVTVTETATSCTATSTASVNNTGAPTVASTDVDVLCNGDSTGIINLTVTGGSTPYSFAWSNGATTEDLDSLPAGSYSVAVFGADSCFANTTVVISEPSAALSTNLTVSPGAIDLNVSGGTTPYTYLWSNGATTEDLDSLASGWYKVTVTDQNNCTKVSDSVNVWPDGISDNNTRTSISVFPNPNKGTFLVQFSSGNGQYHIILRNVIGQIVYNEMVNVSGFTSKQISVPELGQGIYFLNISGGNENRTMKITIK